MDRFDKLESLIENFTDTEFAKLSFLEKAIVLYLKDNEIHEEYFNASKKEADYLQMALPYLSHPRLVNLLAQNIQDKHAFFKIDPTLDFAIEASEQEIYEFLLSEFGIDKIYGQYSAKDKVLVLDSEIQRTIEKFFKIQVVIDITPEIEDLLLDAEVSPLLDIEIRAHHGSLMAHEREMLPLALHFWKHPVKQSLESVSKTIGMGSLVLALSLSACSKGVEYSVGRGPSDSPGIDSPSKKLLMVFANYPVTRGGVEAPTYWPFSKTSRVKFPQVISDYSFSSEIESVNVVDLKIYSNKNSSLLCVYRWTGSNFVLAQDCEVTLAESEALLVRGIPADYSVSIDAEVIVLE